ncbi:MAG: FlgD immunoglobulin-like domain containing protein, partial [Bacillota bacterium]
GKSNADWKFISSGTPFNPSLRAAIEFGIEMQKDPLFRNFPTPYGNFGINDVILELSDKWAGFPEDVYTLTKYVVEHGIKNIIFLTGDTHTSGIDDGNNSVFPELMAGPLDIKNNGFVSLLEIFGIPVFNKGGHTLANGLSQLGNAYGRISVFGADSVLLEAVTESGRIIGRHTVLNNYIPKRISATVAPNSLNFDSTLINTETSRKLIITNNSIDTLIISAVTLSDAHFTSKTQLPVLIPPKSKGVLQISFRPVGYGEVNSGKLVIYSNAQNKPTEINLRGIAAKYSGNKVPAKQPKQFELFQNYPNPFNPNTNITFYLPEASEVKLAVFDSFGREVKLLDKSFREPGIHQLLWDGLNNSGKAVSSGVYYLSLKAGSFTDTKKILLIR